MHKAYYNRSFLSAAAGIIFLKNTPSSFLWQAGRA
jgi:hypothetical protein